MGFDRLSQRGEVNAYLQIYNELEALLAEFSKEDIPVIVLKGAYLAQAVYAKPVLRYMADYDILVQEHDLAGAVDTMRAMGYQASQPIRLESTATLHHLPPFRKEEGVADLEIHWTIVKPNEPQTVDIDALWQRAQPFQVAGVQAKALSPTDMLLHICLHAAHHHLFTQGLRPLYDILKLVERYGQGDGGHGERQSEAYDNTRLNWQDVCERSVSWRCSGGTYLMLYLSYTLLNAKIPPQVLEALKPADISPELVDIAKKCLFAGEDEGGDTISANFMRITGERPMKDKAKLLFDRLLISRRELSLVYDTPMDSLLLYLYYPRRFWDFLMNIGQQAWCYVNNTQKFKDDTDQRNLLINWMEQR